jgi:ketosteroid isomerase-like protein
MQPIEVMRSYLSAMRAGDREAAFEHFADDIVGYVPGRSALAGPRRVGRRRGLHPRSGRAPEGQRGST